MPTVQSSTEQASPHESELLHQVIEAVKNIRDGHPDSGRTLSNMIMGFQSWKLRRRTWIHLISSNTAEYRVTLDLILPKAADNLAFSTLDSPTSLNSEQVLVPLTFLRKGPMPQLRVSGADNVELAYLSRDENSVLSTLFLVELALSVRANHDKEDDIIGDCAKVVLFDQVGSLENDSESYSVIAGIVDRYLSMGDEDALNRFRFFAQLLQGTFLLFVAVDSKGPTRRLINFGYIDEFNFKKRSRGGLLKRSIRYIWSFGSYAFDDVPLHGVADAKSVHVEIALPKSVRARDVKINSLEDDESSGKKSVRDNMIHISWRKASFTSQYSTSFMVEHTNYLGIAATATVSVLLLLLSSVFVLVVSKNGTKAYANEIFYVVPLLLVIPTSLGLFVRSDDEDHILDVVQRPFRTLGFVTVFLQLIFAFSVLVISKQAEHYIAVVFFIGSLLLITPLIPSWWKPVRSIANR